MGTRLSAEWRRGWSAVFAIVIFNAVMGTLFAGVRWLVPENVMLRVPLFVALLVVAAPIVAWRAIRFVFPGAEPLPSLRTEVVASFSDELSAHAALAVLRQGGIDAVVSTAGIGVGAGVPLPVGGVELRVASGDRDRALRLLEQARRSAGK